jgi:hypothetical protein
LRKPDSAITGSTLLLAQTLSELFAPDNPEIPIQYP